MAQAVTRGSALPWYGLAFAGALAFALVGVAAAELSHVRALFWAGNVLSIAWGLYCADKAWRRVDEIARTAQYVAWLWGGMAGLFLVLIAAMTMPLLRETWHGLFAFMDAHRGAWPLHALTFVAGILFSVLAQIVGFLIAWAAWWSAKR